MKYFNVFILMYTLTHVYIAVDYLKTGTHCQSISFRVYIFHGCDPSAFAKYAAAQR